MKYQAEDGKVFETLEECADHEDKLASIKYTMDQVEAFVNSTEKPERSKQMYRRVIREWELFQIGDQEVEEAETGEQE